MILICELMIGVFYGRYVRKLSKRTQRALGELTKVSEERLGNIRTAQAFNGEVQEVNRYNKKIRDLFDLGKKEVNKHLIILTENVGSCECFLLQWVWISREHDRVNGACYWWPDGVVRVHHYWRPQLLPPLYYLRRKQYIWTLIILQRTYEGRRCCQQDF
jgi:ABC-type multidrug transport system fused ATPase/permease subunit